MTDLIAQHETILAAQRRPRFVLRAVPDPGRIRLQRTREEALWIADRIVRLDIFAPGLKNYDLIPGIEHGDYYYFFMGEIDNPISSLRILGDGTLVYSAPAFTPVGFDVYPEMVLAYIVDFLSLCFDFYRQFNYAEPFKIEVQLINVAGVTARISQPGDWYPTPANLFRIERDVSVNDVIPSINNFNRQRIQILLNRFFGRAGLPGRGDDANLPQSFLARLARLA
jgi:hypothetical protein